MCRNMFIVYVAKRQSCTSPVAEFFVLVEPNIWLHFHFCLLPSTKRSLLNCCIKTISHTRLCCCTEYRHCCDPSFLNNVQNDICIFKLVIFPNLNRFCDGLYLNINTKSFSHCDTLFYPIFVLTSNLTVSLTAEHNLLKNNNNEPRRNAT